MIHKLGHVEDLNNIEIKEESIRISIKSYLEVLDTVYGKDRDIDSDDGGYVLYCEQGTKMKDIELYFNYHDIPPEWIQDINCNPKYLSVLYILSSDYAIVVVIAEKDFKKEK